MKLGYPLAIALGLVAAPLLAQTADQEQTQTTSQELTRSVIQAR
jgi:hypothetical protein